MKVFHVQFSKSGAGLSGGEKCMIEVIKHFEIKSIKNILLTTNNGKEIYQKLGLPESRYLKYVTVDSTDSEGNLHVFLSYILRLASFFRIRKSIISSIDYSKDVLICHSDFFPDTISSWFLSRYFQKKCFYWFHMLAPDIFKGFEGHFTNQFSLPTFSLIHYKLNQLLFLFIAKNGKIIINNPYYKNLFKDAYNIKKYSGVKIDHYNLQSEKKYDIVFLGRFHRQKGLFEIPKIMKILKKNKPDIRLALIGGGDKTIERKFVRQVSLEGLESNIEYLGSITSDKKFEYLRQSKVFIFPSYYESFGQVALEAMANGLPVVAYNLPVFSVFEMGMKKVSILNNNEFAKEILSLLNDKEYYRTASGEAVNFAQTFSWDKTGEEILGLITSL